ncbi:hypothetical protein Glove_365g213 [Diversispora epigaea]|uniref:SWIM-type domain-containing protein n=1 Tax=Diversispora epigaea TaxID=1348612 RepID=A0A397HCX5_9GLOM|nr:hypothetical protein Glove_365g213 [Diversispora epigaea]
MNNPSKTNNAGPSTLGKRKATDDKDGSSVAKMRATKNRRFLSAAKRKGKKGREARHVKVCNDDTKARIGRAMSQPMYLIDHKEIDPTKREYTVLGPTGLVYTTVISKTLTCSCPDFASGFHCKHLLFVLLRILKVDRNSDLIFQKALVGFELKSIFNNSPNIVLQPNEMEVRQLKLLASRNQRNRKSIEGNCQVCFDALGNQKILIWCEECGNNIHQECFTEWETSLPADQNVTCVYCRAEWEYSYLEC